jgi:hypothetical protein
MMLPSRWTGHEIGAWTRARKLMRGERLVPNDYGSTHRALRSIGAERLGRASTRGRPWVRLPEDIHTADGEAPFQQRQKWSNMSNLGRSRRRRWRGVALGGHLSFPKIISARSDDAIRTELVWQ